MQREDIRTGENGPYGNPFPVLIDYTNHRGERAERTILPSTVWFGESDWHDGPQWFLRAHDVVKGGDRDFAMRDIHGWRDDR